MWFRIKLNPQCYQGARHVWSLIKFSGFLSDCSRHVVDACVQRNAYFVHPENIILAMLVDEEKEVRQVALRRIKEERQGMKTCHGVRRFPFPQ